MLRPLARSPRSRSRCESGLPSLRETAHHPAMQTTKHGWQIIDGDAGVLSFSYKFSGEGQANCFTAKLPSGGLMIISPPSKSTDEEIADLAPYGEVVAIVANNGFHHLGIA